MPRRLIRPATTKPPAPKVHSADELKNAGFKLVSEGKWRQAADMYTQAISKGGPTAVLLSNRAFCFLKLGRNRDALEDAKAVI
jgi:hypothetical protein